MQHRAGKNASEMTYFVSSATLNLAPSIRRGEICLGQMSGVANDRPRSRMPPSVAAISRRALSTLHGIAIHQQVPAISGPACRQPIRKRRRNRNSAASRADRVEIRQLGLSSSRRVPTIFSLVWGWGAGFRFIDHMCGGLQCFDAVGWAAERASGVQKTERWGAGVVVCLERGADLHMAQLMPLPLAVCCFSKIQIGFTFLVPAHLGSPDEGPLNGCVCHYSVAEWLACWTQAQYGPDSNHSRDAVG